MKNLLARLSLAFLLLPLFAQAQTYPERPIRLIVPWPPGGSADAIGRLIGATLATELGGNVIVENVAGASGALGTQQMVRSQADGYTVLLATSSGNVAGPLLVKKPSFDIIKDFKPVGMAAVVPSILVVNNNAPYKTARDLAEAARRNPGKLSFGSGGNGNSGHLTAELFNSVAKVSAVHVPYKGNNPALTDLMGGQIDFMFDNGAIPLIKGGKVRALAVASESRLQAMPDVPTLVELGFAGVHLHTWFGLAVPANTPQPIVNRLSAALLAAMKQPETQRKLVEMGAEPRTSAPEQFAAFWANEVTRYRNLIQAANIVID